MKKVTVKHYLNANIIIRELDSKGEYKQENIIYHPVYIQISFARRTTQIRSYTEVYLTEKDYEYYKNGDYEKMTNAKIAKHLTHEPQRVKAAIEYLLNKREGEINKIDVLPSGTINKFDDIRYDVENLMEPLDIKLIELGWAYLAMVKQRHLHKETNYLHDAFRLDENLIKSLNLIKQVTGYDLASFFPQKEIVFWKNVNFLIERYRSEEYSFIDFVGNYDSLIESMDEIEDRNTFIKEIKDLIDYTT